MAVPNNAPHRDVIPSSQKAQYQRYALRQFRCSFQELTADQILPASLKSAPDVAGGISCWEADLMCKDRPIRLCPAVNIEVVIELHAALHRIHFDLKHV